MRSHSVTCHSAAVTFPALPQPKLVLDYATPEGWKAELAWATRTVSKQSAQDCYALFIAALRFTGQVDVRSLPRVVEARVELRPFESQV